MGKGSSPPPVAPTFTDPVNGQTFDNMSALNDEIRLRATNDQIASDTKTKADQDAAALAESQYQQRASDAKTQATSNVQDYFKQQGLDPAKYDAQIAAAINTAGQGVVDLAPNPSASYSPNLGANIIADLNSGIQNQATSAITNEFSPTYSQDNINSSWLPTATSSILSSQFDPLSAQLDNAQKRGTLNDAGYAAAQAALSKDKTTAQSTVNTLGSNILASDRTALDSYITGAKNTAGGLNVSTAANFDPTSYTEGASSLVGQDQANFAGDLGNAVGSTSFADINSLLNAGGAAQGATDPSATNPVGIAAPGGAAGGVSDAYIAQQALASQKRGLGTQGAF